MTDMLIMKHYTHIPPVLWPWPNFSPEEMSSNGNGAVQISRRAGDRLQGLRNAMGRSLGLNSAYRDMAYNLSIGSARGSQHPKGTAFDINVRGWSMEEIRRLVQLAYEIGFRGFGGYERGGKPNFIHIDDRGSNAAWGLDWAHPYKYAPDYVKPETPLAPPKPTQSPWAAIFKAIAGMFGGKK